MSAHTPGPWNVWTSTVDASVNISNDQGEFVATAGRAVDGATDADQIRVDAYLIAAAPEMLVALRYFAALTHCDERPEDCSSGSGPCCDTHGDAFVYATAIEDARAAIAKAEGRT